MFLSLVFMILIGSFVTIGICFFVIKKLVFSSDPTFYGKKQSDLMFEINKELSAYPETSKVSFKTSDNLLLSGLLVKRQSPKANVLLCHGYKSAKELMYAFIDLFPQWNMFLFDFRAHGKSEGKITSIGCHEYKDVLAAKKFFQQKISPSAKLPFIIIGISMGGASAIKATEVQPNLCDAMIVDSSYATLSSVINECFSSKSGLPYYPFFPITKLMFQYLANCNIGGMRPVDNLKNIKQPIFFIHSCNDSFILPSESIELFANAKNKHSKLWIGPRCRHGWLHSYHTNLYKKKIFSFLKKAGIKAAI